MCHSKAHLDLILLHGLKRVVAVAADPLVNGQEEQVPPSTAV